MTSSSNHRNFFTMLMFIALFLGTANCGYLKCFSTTCSHTEDISHQGAFSTLYWFDLGPGSEMTLDINANVVRIDLNLKLETHPNAPIPLSIYSDDQHAVTRSEMAWAQSLRLDDCEVIRIKALNTNSEPVTVALSVYAPVVFFANRDFRGLMIKLSLIALLIAIGIAFVLFRRSRGLEKQAEKHPKKQVTEEIEIKELETDVSTSQSTQRLAYHLLQSTAQQSPKLQNV